MRSSGMTWAAYKKHRDRGEYDDYEREQASSLSVVDKDEETRRRYQQYVQGVMASNYQDDIIRNQMMAPYLAEEERRRREEERQREEWQREHIAAMREPVQNGQSVANFDTQAARRKAEPKIRYEQAYDNWNAQNPEFKDKTAEEKYSLFAKELDEQNKLADASQGYRDFYNRNKKDPEFQRMSDDEKRWQYNHYLDQTLQDNGTLPEEQRAEHAEYMYNGLTDKEKALMDTVMRIEGEDYDAYVNGGEQGVPFADPTGRGSYSQNRYNEASQAAEARKAAREKTLDDIRAELRHLGWSDEKIDTEFARYTELEDWRKTQESRDKYNQMVNDPALSDFDRAMIGAGYTAADVLSFIPGSVDTALGYATGDSVYGANASTKHHNMARMAEEGTSQVRNNLIGDEHPVGQALYDIGVSWGESMSSKLLGAALGPAGEDLSLLPFAISSSDVAYRDAVNRGFSQNQATAYAVTVGALEALTEKLPMDRWQELAKNKKWGRNIFTTALTQMGIEGAEELVNGLGAQMADQLAVTIGNTGKTQARLDIEEMMAQGMSEEEAKTAWRKQFAQQLAMDVISGAAAAGPDVAVAAGVRSFRSRYGNNLNEAISDRYKNLKVEGDTAFENNLREEKEKYENNPVQYIADHYKVNSEEDAQVKQALQEIAEKEKEGKKLSVSDKSFITENVLANRDQFNQEYLDTLFDTGEDSIVPYKYRDVKTEVTEDQARTMLAEAAQSGDPKAFIDAQRKVRNSTVDEVAKHAEELIDFYAGSAMEHGITKEDIGKALIAEKQAYIAGITGEELNKDNLTPEAQIAYNDGKMDALKEATRTTIENKDALNTDVTTKEGNTVTLKGVFTSDGIMTDGGAVKLENIDLDENKATNKAYHFADNYESVNVKNNFINNIKDGQNIENYNRDYGRVYDSALAGLSLENVKKESLTELDDDQIENIYETAIVERQARTTDSIAEALNGVKGTGKGKAFNESSSTDPKMLKIAEMMARATKYDIHIVDEVPQNKGARGAFLKNDNAVYVRADDFMRSLGHEFSHYIETYNKGEYDSLRGAVANYVAGKIGSDTFMNAMKGYGVLYNTGANQQLSIEDMSAEAFNDIVPIILESKQGSKAFAKYLAENYGAEEARTFGEKIKDVMDNLAGTIRKYLSNADHPTAYAKEMKKYADELGQFADQFIKALDGAIKNYEKISNRGEQGEGAGESEPKFSMVIKGLNQYTAKKVKLSLAEDSKGRELSEDQQKYYQKIGIKDDQGRLEVMYHGTPEANFTIFDPEYSDDKRSLFFTNNRFVAAGYAGTDSFIDPNNLPKKIKTLEDFQERLDGTEWSIREEDGEYIFENIEEPDDPIEYFRADSFEEAYQEWIDTYAWDGEEGEYGGLYEVYLTAKNPLTIDAEGRDWEDIYADNLVDEDAKWYHKLNIIKTDENGKLWVEWREDQEGSGSKIMSPSEFKKMFGKDLYREMVEEGKDFQEQVYVNPDGTWIPSNTRGLSRYAQEHGYDALIIDNLVDTGAYSSGDTQSKVVVVFNSNQIKSVDNEHPTDGPDIRFSFEDEGGWIDFDEVLGESRSEEKAVDILEKGMEALKNKDVDVPKLRTLALKIRNEYGSSYNANKLADDLRKAFAYMQTEDHVDYQTMMGILKDIARPVIEEAGEKVGEEEYKHFLEYFKGKKIKLTSTQKEEVRHTFGSYGAYRNAMMPITISDNGEFTLDQLWDEMVQHGGYMLDIDANEGDMPINLLDTLQAMRPYVRNDFGGDTEDLAKDLAMRIVEEYIQGESAKEMHKELTEYRNRLKKDYQERLKDLKGRANAEVLARNKRRAEEKAERQKARDLKLKIKQNANKLYTWAVKPTEGKSVPHNMMVPVMQFLQGIDFVDPVITVGEDGKYHIRLFDRVDYEDGHKKFIYKDLVGDTREDVLRQFNEAIGRGEGTKEQRSWTDKMQGIRDIYNKVLMDTDFEDTDMDFLMQTLDAQGLAEEFDDMLSRHKGQLDMNNLTAKELKLINNVITNIFHAVNQGNKAYSMNADITNLAQDTIKESEGKTLKNRGKYSQMIHDFLRIDNATPVTFFDLLGKGASKIYGALRNGLNQEILDIKKASEFMKGIMKEVDKKEVQKWTGKKATVHEFNLTNGSIKMTDAQIMGLYLTIRRTGGMERIKGGIKVGDIKQNGKTINQDVIHLTDGDIKQIESVLTPEQISLAQKMQKYMAVDCSAQGNETSMKLYGYKKFTDPTYYPWTVDKDTVATTNTSENIPMFNSLERSGFTKQLKEGAKNPLVINDIFDVFTDHVSQMAGYHGYAASLKDTLRWMNYREMAPQDGGFVRYITNKNAINVLSGSKKGVGYIRDLMLDINKARKSDYIGNVTEALMGNYKAAAVGANARVVMQQPTAYLRALNIIDPQYLMGINPATAVKNIKKSQEECPISWWKSKGYYETNLGQPLKEIVTGIASPTEKAKDVMMAPAGYADDITWGFLYTAVEKEQRARFKGQNVSAEEFRKAVNDRFDELVDTTQVVDSALHRSAYMRSKDKLNILQTAFMAEPTKTYNMIMKAVIEDAREGKTMKRTSRAAIAFLLTAIFNAAAQSIPDVWRHAGDDDDYWEKFMEYLQSNFTDNINPLNLLPIVKDIAPEILNFGDSTWSKSNSRFDIDAVTTLFKDATSLYKYFFGESNKTGYGALMSFLRPLSQITGIPMYNLTRDTVSIYNAFFDNLETTVNNGTTRKNEKKKSFVSDVNRERSEETLDEGIVDAIENGVSIYDLKGAVRSEYKNKYFDAYAEGNTEEAQAIAERAARAYARMGMSDEDIDAEINEWQEETITYALLDKAIASGEGIEEEIRHVQEGKADEKIIKHIMDRFSDTIAYEDVHETESDWRGNVEKALQAIDPTLTFDTANEEAMQQAAEKAAEQQAKEEKAGYKADFFASVESKNGTAGRKALDGLKAMGVDAKSAKTMVSTKYHDAWKEAKTPAEKQKAKSDWMSAYKLVCNYYGVEYKDLDKTWSDWEKDQ